MDLEDMWFQQDSATYHVTLMHVTFPDRVIFQFSRENRPPRSGNLMPLDFFLWGFLKSKVYASNPRPSKPWRIRLDEYHWNPATVMPKRDWKFCQQNTNKCPSISEDDIYHICCYIHNSHMSTLFLNQNFAFFSKKSCFILNLHFLLVLEHPL